MSISGQRAIRPTHSESTLIDATHVADKNILFIGYGGQSKLHFYEEVREWGANVAIAHSELDCPPNNCASSFLRIYGMHEHSRDNELGEIIVQATKDSSFQVDAVLTLWEDCGPLAAIVAKKLGLPGISPVSAGIAKSKIKWQSILRKLQNNGVRPLAPLLARSSTISDLNEAVVSVGLPTLLKLEFGSSAAGVTVVNSLEEAQSTWLEITRGLKTEEEYPGIGLGFGGEVIVSELLTGTEHDVDIVLFDGDVLASFVTDNGPTRLPNCAEATAIMPTLQPSCVENQLVDVAKTACTSIGLETGTFNVEIINTTEGPCVIDINARMGGFYIREWIKVIWEYDLLLAAVLCSLRIPYRNYSKSSIVIVGAMLVPSVHSKWFLCPRNRHHLEVLSVRPEVSVSIFNDHPTLVPFVDEPFANIAVSGASKEEALEILFSIWNELRLDICDPEIKKLFAL